MRKEKRKAKGIYKRAGSPYFHIRYTIDGIQYRESSESIKEKDAELLLAQRIYEGKKPEINKACTFRELAGKYLSWSNGRQRSAITKGYVIGQFITVIGDVQLRNFSTLKVEQLQTDLINKGYAVASINKVMNILKHMFSKAVEWDLINDDTIRSIRKVKTLKGENKRLRYLSQDESLTLIDACENHLKAVVITALNTGCRKGEILSLKWDNVNLRNGFIILDKTKNGERREIPINETLKQTLQGIARRYRLQHTKANPVSVTILEEVRAWRENQADSPYVFFDPVTGKPYKDVKRSFHTALKKVEVLKCPECSYQRSRVKSNEKNIQEGYCPNCKIELTTTSGIQDFHFHDLRHTFASQLVMAGADIFTVSKLLGHKSLKMTLRYAHLAPSHMTKAVNLLDGYQNEDKISTKVAHN